MKTQHESDLNGRLVELQSGRKGLIAAVQVRASKPPSNAPANCMDFRSSDDTLDRYQETIDPAGWKLDNYRRNPVVQNAHSYACLSDTIGKSLVTEVRGGALFQRVQFAVNENPLAKVAYDLYQGGFLNAVSVGFIPIRWENGNAEAGYRRKYLEQELLEVSAVSIPANPNALALAVKSGAVKRGDLRELEKLLQHIGKATAAPAPARASFPELLTLLNTVRNQFRNA